MAPWLIAGSLEFDMNEGPPDMSSVKPPTSASTPAQMNHTWFPILGGILGGMVVWIVPGMLELPNPAFYHLSVWIFNETDPKNLYAIPGYYWVQRAILLVLVSIGGGLGMPFSRWPYSKSILFLSVSLIVIAIFAALGFNR
jgi:hypothetical protein